MAIKMATETETKIEPWEFVWTDKEKKKFQFYKRNGNSLTIEIGSWLSLPGRPDKVIVDRLYDYQSKKNEDADNCGPCGISYRPWRENENRFASLLFGMRGNERFIVCYPAGIHSYGSHIDWDNVQVCTKPENVTEAQLSAALGIMREDAE